MTTKLSPSQLHWLEWIPDAPDWAERPQHRFGWKGINEEELNQYKANGAGLSRLVDFGLIIKEYSSEVYRYQRTEEGKRFLETTSRDVAVRVRVPDSLWQEDFDSAKEFIEHVLYAGVEDMGLNVDVKTENNEVTLTLK